MRNVHFTLLLLAGLTVACSQADESYNVSEMTEGATALQDELIVEDAAHKDFDKRSAQSTTTYPATSATVDKVAVPQTPVSTPRILIREGDCRLGVDSLEWTMRELEYLTTHYDGYLADLQWQNTPYQKRARFVIRVPADHFQLVLDSLRQWATYLDHQNISAKDVSEEYVDLQARLRTKKDVRDRYVAILRSKASTVEEVLLAEEKIRRLQEEIEAKEGRLRFLAQRSAMSLIRVDMYQDISAPPVVKAGWLDNFVADNGRALGNGASIVRGLYLGLLSIWPLLILIGWLWWKRKAWWPIRQ